ncbi:hypothetical protein BV898_01090 [Hypsibius exemplaris]|uniref:ZP domain-containing protein n=1 Tax=Hypsibius exemplaris TaxID=2072580 RepID=A0A1W0XD55_HYPEX|nr:hypothetical protein BV898_01090 [Hypsibius exemplaris]
MSAWICSFFILALATQLSSGQDPEPHNPGEHDFIKVDVEVIQLFNPQGLLGAGGKCDSSGECDPKLTVYLDTDQPLSAWPGAKAAKDYAPFFKASNQNSPLIQKNVSVDVCGGSVNKVNLRVHVVDEDMLGGGNVIDDFECVFAADYGRIARSVALAEWSPTLDCKPRLQNNQARLQYRFRLYDIPASDCGIKSETVVRS